MYHYYGEERSLSHAMQPFHVTVCGMLDAGEFNTTNLQDVLKLNLCIFTAIVVDELEIFEV